MTKDYDREPIEAVLEDFFIVEPSHDTANVLDWYAVATEEAGGIVAYFRDLEEAEKYRARLIEGELLRLKI